MTEIINVLTALAAFLAAVVSILNHFQSKQIHLIVNSQRDQLVKEISDLKDKLRAVVPPNTRCL